MMELKMEPVTLVALVAAVIGVWKLLSILGRDDGIDRKIERSTPDRRPAAPDARKVVTVPRRDGSGTVSEAVVDAPTHDDEQKIRVYAGNNDALAQGLLEVYRTDPAFDPQSFVNGANQAYEMIVTAFAEGNRKTLKDLLSRDVYDGFLAEMTAREKRGDLVDQSFVGINKSEIVDAELKGGVANITVRFVSQLISATRDRSGVVTGGDPQKIKDVTDVWMFSREIGSARARANPNWKLISTQES
jgi:predicted lipid-binding transport protein (Tim44 family)